MSNTWVFCVALCQGGPERIINANSSHFNGESEPGRLLERTTFMAGRREGIVVMGESQ